ncbi:4a-hydroxytetrahydrobiopterin dehydratase [Aquirufa lenticrescens]|uniref:4a-hydroxytetrahydrobiopterin dehydratase n=1 Tax=Aquirufa lenticrescens TaxID=2696560 RepID=UPI0021BC4ECA|nr:4a-hydroxytetrahydrobiopterin dehydratase [Aquirufa lenticrescens]
MKSLNKSMTSWKTTNQSLEKTFEFATFEEAMQFMQEATPFISQTDHHPTWSNTYNRVQVTITTHDAGNQVTEKDYTLANYLDELFKR